MLGVLLYVVLYTIWYQRGYQSTDVVIGTTSIKVKGTGVSGSSMNVNDTTVYDAIDLVVPATEQDAVFIATSQIITENQTRGICEGNYDTVRI